MAADESPTVLIVEDEENVAQSYELYLQSAYEVRIATNGGEALVALEDDVDVVLLDRRMPGMSGDEVCEYIEEWAGHCRVVMVTAVDPDPDIVDMTFDDYLSKPVDKDDLIETVEQMTLLDRYEALLSEYNSVVRTYATLKSQLSRHVVQESEHVAELEGRKAELREQIDEVIDQFDDEMASVLRQAHHSG